MTLTCRIFGHKYDDGEVEEREENQNGKKAVIEISKKECNRCGHVVEERLNTRITDSQTRHQTQTERRTTDSRRDSSDSAMQNAGYTDAETEILEEDADGGVILDSDSGSSTDETGLNSGVNTDVSTDPTDSERTSADDEGVVVLGDRQSGDSGTQFRISCESCGFSKTERETSRRDGDLCPSCGSWLTVQRSDE